MPRGVLSCSVQMELALRLARFAELAGVTVSSVVQTAVERYLSQEDPATEDEQTRRSDHTSPIGGR